MNDGVETHTLGVLTNISFSSLGFLIISLSTKFKVPPDVKHG